MFARSRRWLDSVVRIIGAAVLLNIVLYCSYKPFYSHEISPQNGHVMQGYLRAVECYGDAPVDLQDLHFYVVDQHNLFLPTIVGFTSYHNIFVVKRYADDANVWGHEVMHAFGVVGHPPGLFDRCGFE